MRVLRVATVLLYSLLSFGFRSMDDRHWSVSNEEPVIWLELDEQLYASDGFGDKVEGASSELEVLQGLPAAEQRPEVWRLILADFDSVKTSFLRLRLKPGQIPELDRENDYAYDASYAQAHTIQLVVENSRGASSGFASPVFSGSVITNCRIVIAPKTLGDPLFFKHVLTHETMHCLGLNHQQDDADSIMSYSNSSASMSPEERMALTHLYPRDSTYAKESPTFGMACTPAK